jgi:hypothetical protein
MTHPGTGLAMAIVLLLGVGACERQGPPPKPIGSATNKHVEETPAAPVPMDADAMTRNMKTPLENAWRTEDVLTQSADRTRRESHEAPTR